jgi:TolB-like protein/tetratricopeptide (TPR) repeat protein/tRNA A-37 threonylcarbamoyl transferase component Bud32
MSAARDLRAALEHGLAGRYRIERELGQGGMAVVFLAHDVKHERRVAVKVLLPEVATAIGAERFLREIKVTANLQHPNILPLFDSGEVASYLYYVMPFVEGESLGARLGREKQLPIEDALHIATVVANALDYAHRHGVVHRDLKPDNILLHEGEPLVADFGIALAVPEPGAERLTATGMSMGTPHYMSPEQATGDRAVDARTDIYALGAVTYEMLTGEPPHLGKTAQAIVARILTEAPRPVRATRGTVSEQVDAAITRALEKTPADRWETAHDFAVALATPAQLTATAPSPSRARRRTRIGVTIAAAVLVVAGAAALLSRYAHAGARTRIAVLPFVTRGDSGANYFAEGIADEIRNKLFAVKTLEVIARSSMPEYRNTTKQARRIGSELGVKYYLSGDVRFAARGRDTVIDVSVELVDASTEAIKWSGAPIRGVLADVFKTQSRIAREVADSLGVALGADEQTALASKPTENLEAYQAFLQGERAWDWPTNSGGPAFARMAMPYYLKAVELDPRFGTAWARLGYAYTSLSQAGVDGAAESARRAAQRAVDLEPNASAAHDAKAFYFRWVLHDHRKALDELKAIHDPASENDEMLFRLRGPAKIQLGQLDDGIGDLRHALALSPRSPAAARPLAHWLAWVRLVAAADTMADLALGIDSTSEQPYNTKILIRLAAGNVADARAQFDRAQRNARFKATVPMVNYSPMMSLTWFLDEAQGKLWLANRTVAKPSVSGERPQDGTILIADYYRQRGDAGRARLYADSARVALERDLKTTNDSALVLGRLGLVLAFLPERKREAIAQEELAVAMIPLAKDEFQAVLLQQLLVRVYIMTGETEKALDTLEPLLRFHAGYLTPAWLRIDPTFAPLKGNPRFEKLIAAK